MNACQHTVGIARQRRRLFMRDARVCAMEVSAAPRAAISHNVTQCLYSAAARVCELRVELAVTHVGAVVCLLLQLGFHAWSC